MAKKILYIIAGCNGAGKTTASYTILPEIIQCKEFINADEIAKGLSPFQPEKVAFEAGRIMLERIDLLLEKGESFAFETTLSTRSHKNRILDAQKKGYQAVLIFYWLRNHKLAEERVKIRVLEGGHNIPKDVIERRYYRGINNLFDIYLPLVDQAWIIDNSEGESTIMAILNEDNSLVIEDKIKFNQLKSYADKK